MVVSTSFILFSTLTILVVAISLTSTAEAQENATDSNGSQFLAIQHAQSGSISAINSTNFLLQLDEISDKTILFSDRPDRIVVTQSIDDFIGNWTEGKDSFQVDPPNAALVILEEGNQKEDTLLIELFNPKYDKNQQTLRYDFTLLGNATALEISKNLGEATLIVDDLSAFWNKTKLTMEGQCVDPSCARR